MSPFNDPVISHQALKFKFELFNTSTHSESRNLDSESDHHHWPGTNACCSQSADIA